MEDFEALLLELTGKNFDIKHSMKCLGLEIYIKVDHNLCCGMCQYYYTSIRQTKKAAVIFPVAYSRFGQRRQIFSFLSKRRCILSLNLHSVGRFPQCQKLYRMVFIKYWIFISFISKINGQKKPLQLIVKVGQEIFKYIPKYWGITGWIQMEQVKQF